MQVSIILPVIIQYCPALCACKYVCMYVCKYVCMYNQSPLNQAPWDPRVSVSQKCQLQGKFVVFSNIIQ